MFSTVKNIIVEVENNSIKENTEYKPQFLILDSHYIADGLEGSEHNHHRDIDYVEYRYKKASFNRVKVGDWFVYRKPQKSAKQGCFYFYGIGKVLEIIPDETSTDVSIIKVGYGYKFLKPLFQDNERLMNYKWEFKSRPNENNFANFFQRYGMNLITETDFMELFGDMLCIPAKNDSLNQTRHDQLESLSEEEVELDLDQLEGFSLNIHSEEIKGNQHNPVTHKITPRKTDFNRINKNKKKLGTLGELIVKEMEKNYLIEAGRPDLAEQINHVAAEADGYGYDLISFDPETGDEKYIEVKTTKSKEIDGFYMSPREIAVSQELPDKYYIYRLYNLNIEEKTADLRIFKGAITDSKYNLTSVSYKITLK